MAPKKKPTGELKDQRIPIMMSEAELTAIDDWSFEHRIRSRGEAIRRLCQMGIVASESAGEALGGRASEALNALSNLGEEINRATENGLDSDLRKKFIEPAKVIAKLAMSCLPLAVKIEELRDGESVADAMASATSLASGFEMYFGEIDNAFDADVKD